MRVVADSCTVIFAHADSGDCKIRECKNLAVETRWAKARRALQECNVNSRVRYRVRQNISEAFKQQVNLRGRSGERNWPGICPFAWPQGKHSAYGWEIVLRGSGLPGEIGLRLGAR